MIIVNIAGGLGNQMFQFALGQAMSIKTGQEVRYCIDDLNGYNTSRVMELEDAFDLHVPRANRQELYSLIGRWRSTAAVRRVLARPQASPFRSSRFVVEQSFLNIKDFLNRIKSGAYLHGYWQSQDYFESEGMAIKNSFQFRDARCSTNQMTIARILSGKSIGIHIRRGDYLSNPKALERHGVLDSEYYLSAITRLRASFPDARVFAFSDDHDWVYKEILSKITNCESINCNKGRESFRDMQLMSMCDNLVIANSSFSWWAAWLNSKPYKRIIAPKQWFANHMISDSHLVPSCWERI